MKSNGFLQYPSNTPECNTSGPYWMQNNIFFGITFCLYNNLRMIIISEYSNIIRLYYPSDTIYCMCHKLMLYIIFYIVYHIIILSNPCIYDMLCLGFSFRFLSGFEERVLWKNNLPCNLCRCKANNPKVDFILNTPCIPTY